MATIHKLIEFRAYCTCGRPLEQYVPANHATLDYVTFKPCPCQRPEKPQDREEPERLGDGHRGERST